MRIRLDLRRIAVAAAIVLSLLGTACPGSSSGSPGGGSSGGTSQDGGGY